MSAERTGGEILCHTLEELGVRHVFGLPGTQNVELYEALRASSLTTILTSHELGASFMANGYARASGRVGVLATIPGPGFTYAFPGLAEARLDSAPLLHLVGQPPRSATRRFLHQAIPQRAMAEPLVKAVVRVESPGEMAEAARQAYRVALAGEPGPVVLHLAPEAVGGRAASRSSVPEEPAIGVTREWVGRVPELATLALRAQRPLLLLGQGAAGASADVLRLAERLGAAVVTTASGRGVVPEDHPLSLAFEYLRGGLAELNETLEQTDLILALGCKLGHNGSGGFRLRLPEAHLVHVDADPEALGANYPARMLLNTRVEDLVAALLEALGPARPTAAWSADDIADIRTRLAGPSGDPEPRVRGVEPETAAAFFRGLRDVLPREAVLVTDSGLHQYLARRHFAVLSPRGLVMPTDFQSMGFGLPAALGAKLACPDRPVVAVIGDGGLIMSAMELLTAVREEIPVVVVVFNDGHLNLIRLQQMRDWGRLSSVELLNPDMELLARSLGVAYRRFEGDFRAAVAEPITSREPTLVEVHVGDSPGIRSMARRGAVRGVVRRALPRALLDRLKRLLGRG